MKKVTPFLMFDNNADEAMEFYVSIFKNSKIIDQGTFEIDGQEFFVFNGGPYFKFSEGISLFINCDTQQEVDKLWEKLSVGGGKASVAGLRTNLVFHGKLSLPFLERC